jgi:hypothetical protein
MRGLMPTFGNPSAGEADDSQSLADVGMRFESAFSEASHSSGLAQLLPGPFALSVDGSGSRIRPSSDLSFNESRNIMSDNLETPRTNFIRQIIEADLAAGKHDRIVTRFPPEPNGYLHIGHAKSIVLNFGLAQAFQGTCNLRFDDTNPHKENVEFVDSIKADVRWLGFDWGDRVYFASDYFEQLYGFAIELIEKGLAYVCDLSAEETRAYRGTLTEPGRDSPYRNRSIGENLISSSGCVPASSRTAPAPCGRASTWRHRTSTCATRCSTASSTGWSTIRLDPHGVSIPPTTTRTPSPTHWRASPTRSARSSSRTIARSTIGVSITSRCPASRARSSSAG